jgi:hypothetical protein
LSNKPSISFLKTIFLEKLERGEEIFVMSNKCMRCQYTSAIANDFSWCQGHTCTKYICNNCNVDNAEYWHCCQNCRDNSIKKNKISPKPPKKRKRDDRFEEARKLYNRMLECEEILKTKTQALEEANKDFERYGEYETKVEFAWNAVNSKKQEIESIVNKADRAKSFICCSSVKLETIQEFYNLIVIREKLQSEFDVLNAQYEQACEDLSKYKDQEKLIHELGNSISINTSLLEKTREELKKIFS